MAFSMTGYGSGSASLDGREITVELRSVNHRYLDLSFRSPKSLGFAEDELRHMIQSAVARGHIDVFMTYKNTRDDSKTLRRDDALASAYMEAASELSKRTGLANDLTLRSLMELPGVLVEEDAEDDRDALLGLAKDAMGEALSALVSMRGIEGGNLSRDLLFHADIVTGIVTDIEARLPAIESEQRERLRAKLNEILEGAGIDGERLEQEVVILVERGAIDEETSRLRSHLSQVGTMLSSEEGSVGRKLDFLVQEMNREINTIGSKSSDIEIANLVVRAKSEIEKIREQVQNVE